jgi:galactose-1-phosphate uridylyltransferase
LVRVVPNLYPAFAGDPDGARASHPYTYRPPASGLHEVLMFAPEHDLSLDRLDVRGSHW